MSFPYINAYQQFFDSSGAPLASGTIEFRDPTSNDLINSYPTADNADAQTNANDNPLTLNASGAAPTGLFLEDGVKYKVIVKDVNGATIATHDDVPCPIELPYSQTAAESAAGVTPTNVEYPPGDVRRYGATGDGVTDDTTAVQNAIDVAEVNSGHVYFFEGTYLGNWTITAALTIHATLGVILKGNTASAVVNCTGDFVNVIGGLKIDGDSTSIYAWHHEGANNCKLDSLWLTGATSHGLYILGISGDGAYYNQWDNLVSKSNGGDGVKIDGTDTPAHRANVNNFYGGQVSSNTGDGFDIDTCAGTGIFGTSIETNTGYALNFTDCVIAALTMQGGWIESNTAGGVNVDATTKMVQIYGTRFNQSTPFTGAGIANAGNVFMVDSAAGVLTRWMQTIGQNLQSPYIVAPLQQTEKVTTLTGTDSGTNTLTALMSGQTFTNNGEGSADTVIYLPATAVGLQYTFNRNSGSYALRVEPNGTNVIRNAGTAGGAGKYLSIDTNAGSVSLLCVVDTVWEVVAINGGTISFEA